MTLDLKKARAICETATPGPWGFRQSGICASVPTFKLNVQYTDAGSLRSGDAEFIAFARTALPEALDLIEDYRSEIDSIRTDLNKAEAKALSWNDAVIIAKDKTAQAEFDLEKLRKRLELAEAVCRRHDKLAGGTVGPCRCNEHEAWRAGGGDK